MALTVYAFKRKVMGGEYDYILNPQTKAKLYILSHTSKQAYFLLHKKYPSITDLYDNIVPEADLDKTEGIKLAHRRHRIIQNQREQQNIKNQTIRSPYKDDTLDDDPTWNPGGVDKINS